MAEGNLLDSITYDTLIFKGEFSNLGINVITISKPLTINGNNAVLKNSVVNDLGVNIIAQYGACLLYTSRCV